MIVVPAIGAPLGFGWIARGGATSSLDTAAVAGQHGPDLLRGPGGRGSGAPRGGWAVRGPESGWRGTTQSLGQVRPWHPPGQAAGPRERPGRRRWRGRAGFRARSRGRSGGLRGSWWAGGCEGGRAGRPRPRGRRGRWRLASWPVRPGRRLEPLGSRLLEDGKLLDRLTGSGRLTRASRARGPSGRGGTLRPRLRGDGPAGGATIADTAGAAGSTGSTRLAGAAGAARPTRSPGSAGPAGSLESAGLAGRLELDVRTRERERTGVVAGTGRGGVAAGVAAGNLAGEAEGPAGAGGQRRSRQLGQDAAGRGHGRLHGHAGG